MGGRWRLAHCHDPYDDGSGVHDEGDVDDKCGGISDEQLNHCCYMRHRWELNWNCEWNYTKC